MPFRYTNIVAGMPDHSLPLLRQNVPGVFKIVAFRDTGEKEFLSRYLDDHAYFGTEPAGN